MAGSNLGKTLSRKLGRRQSISACQHSTLTRRFIAMASSMSRWPSQRVLATPRQSAKSAHDLHSRSAGHFSSTSIKHHRKIGVAWASACSTIRCISPAGRCKVENASTTPAAMIGSPAEASPSSEDLSRFDFVTSCAASHTAGSNSSTSSHRNFCTCSPRTARCDCVSTAADEPLSNSMRPLRCRPASSLSASFKTSGCRYSHMRRLCSSDPPRMRIWHPGLKSRSSSVAAAPSRVLPPPRGAQTTKSRPGSKNARLRYSSGEQ